MKQPYRGFFCAITFALTCLLVPSAPAGQSNAVGSVNSLGMKMVAIAPGSFVMGA